MWLDVACGMVLVFLAVRGWMKGLMRQVLHAAAAVAGVVLAPRVGPQLVPYARSLGLNLPDGWMDVGCVVAGGLGIYLAIAVVGKLMLRVYRVIGGTGRKPGAIDHTLGLALGLAKGLVAVVLCLSGLDLAGSKGWYAETWLARERDESRAYKWTSQYQPLAWVMDLEGLGRRLSTGGAGKKVESARELLKNLPEQIRWERLRSSAEPAPPARQETGGRSGIEWNSGAQ